MQGGSKLKRILLAVLLGIGLPQSAIASGETIGSVSHIHNVEVFQKDILLGTHEGLYRYEKGGKLILLGEEKFDVMGLTIDGKKVWASGHPGPGSKLTRIIGLSSSRWCPYRCQQRLCGVGFRSISLLRKRKMAGSAISNS